MDDSACLIGYPECRGLLSRLVIRLKEIAGDDLLAAALYGSVARGQGRHNSDLDLLIVYRGEREAMLRRFVDVVREIRKGPEYLGLVQEGFQPDPYPVFFDEAALARHPWLLLDVLDHGIVLVDQEKVLERELARLKARLDELGSRKVTLPDGTWYWDLKPDWKPGEIVEL